MPLTCLSCNVGFEDPEAHKTHFRSDWHRLNLKRKVAGIPPIGAAEFTKAVLQERQASTAQEEPVYCKFCRKSFTNPKSYDNHLQSKKHKENEKDFVEEKDDSDQKGAEKMVVDEECFEEDIDSDEWEDVSDNPIDNNDCLFCGHHSRNLVVNLRHMSEAHTFFIPDVEFCIDIRGFLQLLGDKINESFMCLWCNEKGRSFQSADAARQHMLDKGHCKVLYEGLALAEYSEFYDYSSSYPDANQEGVDVDEEIEVPELDASEYQLVLPSGAVIGHRSLMRYYRQNIDPNRQVAIVKNSKKLHKVLSTYRALGWNATNIEAAAKTARDIHYMKRLQSKLRVSLGTKANKLQTHFRQQVNY